MSMAAQIALALAAFLCSLVAGFLLAFALVIMPGIRNLGDREFLRSFQEIDGVIQRGRPLFGLVWLGSVVVLVIGLALGVGQAGGFERMLLALSGGVYLLGVQLPTFIVSDAETAQSILDLGPNGWPGPETMEEQFTALWGVG